MDYYRNTFVEPGHPAALLAWSRPRGRKLQISEHRLKLFMTIGFGPHLCHWCSTTLNWGRGVAAGCLTVDHLDGDITNNNRDNLAASCNGCNSKRGRKWRPQIRPDEDTVSSSYGYQTRAVRMECGWCGASFLGLPARKMRPGANYCDRSCAGKAGAALRWSAR